MKKYLTFILIILLCSFFKRDTEVSIRADDFMDYCNKNNIKAQVIYKQK